MKTTVRLGLLGAFVVTVGLPILAQAQDFVYTINGDNTVTITEYLGAGGDVTIPDTLDDMTVTGIGDSVFLFNFDLTSVMMSTNVTSIGNWAFAGTSLTTVTIPDGVVSIGSSAFRVCSCLTDVTIGDSVASIGDKAFYYCDCLCAITVNASNSVYSSLEGVLFDKSQTTLIQCPGGKTGSYTIPAGVTNIKNDAFSYCSSLTRVTLGTNIGNLENNAFSYCSGLAAVYFKGDAPTVGSGVFAYDSATIYYLPGIGGWESLGYSPTALWNPQVKNDASFGVLANQFGFTFTNAGNPMVVVEACTNLANNGWSPVATNTLTGGSSYFGDPDWQNHPARFYRFQMP